MSLFVTSLNSGSNGNCFYIGNKTEAVLIDAGISCRETEKRMKNLHLSMQQVKAIFISHEHSDHIRGVQVMATKYKLPVYITPDTLYRSNLLLEKDIVRSFTANESVQIGNLTVIPFTKHHDAIDPYSFVIEESGTKVGVLTDIGTLCEQVIHHFKQCNAVFLESNYDEQMLEEGNYPLHLKKRIRGGKGHLSNKQALDLFITHRPIFLSHVFLSHLSANNNNAELVHQLFTRHAGKTKIVVASRYRETPLYTISNNGDLFTELRSAQQMTLFE
ncbi:MAG: MBL fold metallo-hydrolase [Bacteroidota bacterium]